jgi:hypothetical protein
VGRRFGVSYRLEFAPKAKEGLAALELWLQEETYDEIDGIATDPSSLVVRPGDPISVHDFTRVRGTLIHYVFVTLERDDSSRTLRIVTVGHVMRAEP